MDFRGIINNTAVINGGLNVKVPFSGAINGETVAQVTVAIQGEFTGSINGSTEMSGAIGIRRDFEGHIDGSTEINVVPALRRDHNNPPRTEGVQAYAVFFPPWQFLYHDQEPGSFTTSVDEINGLVTGVKKLGSQLMAAFVDEPVDIRWFGAIDGVDNWGDGNHVSPPGFIHTYAEPGLYWLSRTSSDGESANAARQIHVVRRNTRGGRDPLYNEAQNAEFGWEGNPIWTHSQPYDVIITDPTEGSVDGAFAMKFSVIAKGEYPNDDLIQPLPAGSGVCVFIEAYEDGIKQPYLQIVAGGFTAQRTLLADPNINILTGIAFDPLYWLNLQQMREQYYVSQGLITAQSLSEAAYLIWLDTVDECGEFKRVPQYIPNSSSYEVNIPALDLALLGYVPEHILPGLRPDIAAAHIIQHVRITCNEHPAPMMWNKPEATDFGNLGQFANIYVSPVFNEKTALGGFHSFNVSAGSVLTNIRQMLENQGATFYSRSDLTYVMDYKPYYKDTPINADLDIELPKALSPLVIGEGVPQPLWRVQVQKPILAFDFNNVTLPNDGSTPLNPATGEPASAADLGLIIKSKAYINGLLGVSAAEWSAWYKAVAMPLYQAMDSPMTVDLNNWNYYNDSLDQRNFLWEVEVGDPGGLIIGPIQNVFTDNLQNFAIGVAKEKVAHWQIDVPFANVHEINVGHIVAITHESKALDINWVKKLFWVIGIRVLLMGNIHTRQVTLLEINPSEVVVHTPDD